MFVPCSFCILPSHITHKQTTLSQRILQAALRPFARVSNYSVKRDECFKYESCLRFLFFHVVTLNNLCTLPTNNSCPVLFYKGIHYNVCREDNVLGIQYLPSSVSTGNLVSIRIGRKIDSRTKPAIFPFPFIAYTYYLCLCITSVTLFIKHSA